MYALTLHHLTLGQTEKFGWKVLPHPPCSRDLAPPDYYLFQPLQDHMRGQQYQNDEALQPTERTWLQNAETDFYHGGIYGSCNPARNGQTVLEISGNSGGTPSTSNRYLVLYM
jgi:hypothetical protein